MKSFLFSTALLAAAIDGVQAKLSGASYFYNKDRPLVISHRGSTGHFPEHSAAGYADAFFNGADFIELDIQMTKDGQLVTNHDPTLKETTDVESYKDRYQDRMKTKTIQPGNHYYKDDYFFDDFTLEEIKTFRRKQRFPHRSNLLDGLFDIRTIQEVIDQVDQLNSGARVSNADTKAGLYIEIKQYKYYKDEHNVDMAEKLFDALNQNGLGQIADCESKIPIIIQSFEEDALKKFSTMSDLPLIMLVNYETSLDYDSVAQYAHGIGPDAQYVMYDHKWNTKTDNERSKFIDKMHGLELAVHPYTLRNDQLKFRDSAYEETKLYVDKGVDGVFTEYPSSTFAIFEGLGSKADFPVQEELMMLVSLLMQQ